MLKPALAKAVAIPAPMPLVEPVIKADFFRDALAGVDIVQNLPKWYGNKQSLILPNA
jgi:hypothetical protein